MASTQHVATEAEIHKKNKKQFEQLRAKLTSDSEALYLSAAQTLTTWLDNRKAYYPAAREEILQCLQEARATLKRISKTRTQFTMQAPLDPALGQRRSAYYHLVKVVEKYAEHFTDERHISTLNQLIASVRLGNNAKPPGPPPVVPKKSPRGKPTANPAAPVASSSTLPAVSRNQSPTASRRSSLASEITAATGKTLSSANSRHVDKPSLPATETATTGTGASTSKQPETTGSAQGASSSARPSTPPPRRARRLRGSKSPTKAKKVMSQPDDHPSDSDTSQTRQIRPGSPIVVASSLGSAVVAPSAKEDAMPAESVDPPQQSVMSTAPPESAPVHATDAVLSTHAPSAPVVAPDSTVEAQPQSPEDIGSDLFGDAGFAEDDTPAPETVVEQSDTTTHVADSTNAPPEVTTSTTSQGETVESTTASMAMPTEAGGQTEQNAADGSDMSIDQNGGDSQNSQTAVETSLEVTSATDLNAQEPVNMDVSSPDPPTHSVFSPPTASESSALQSQPPPVLSTASIHRDSSSLPETIRSTTESTPPVVTQMRSPVPSSAAVVEHPNLEGPEQETLAPASKAAASAEHEGSSTSTLEKAGEGAAAGTNAPSAQTSETPHETVPPVPPPSMVAMSSPLTPSALGPNPSPGGARLATPNAQTNQIPVSGWPDTNFVMVSPSQLTTTVPTNPAGAGHSMPVTPQQPSLAGNNASTPPAVDASGALGGVVKERKKPRLKPRGSNASAAPNQITPAAAGLYLPWEKADIAWYVTTGNVKSPPASRAVGEGQHVFSSGTSGATTQEAQQFVTMEGTVTNLAQDGLGSPQVLQLSPERVRKDAGAPTPQAGVAFDARTLSQQPGPSGRDDGTSTAGTMTVIIDDAQMRTSAPTDDTNASMPIPTHSAEQAIDPSLGENSGLKRVHEVIQDASVHDKGLKRRRNANGMEDQSVGSSAVQTLPVSTGNALATGDVGDAAPRFVHKPCGTSRFTAQEVFLADFEVGQSLRGDVVTLKYELSQEQVARVDDWKKWFKHDKDVSGSLCLSLACYPSIVLLKWESKEEENDAEVVSEFLQFKSSWPTNNMLYMEVGSERMSLSPPQLMGTEEGFVDISALVKNSRIEVKLRHYTDLSRYLFALLVHPPTESQLSRVNNTRSNQLKWKEAVYKFSRPLEVLPLSVSSTTTT